MNILTIDDVLSDKDRINLKKIMDYEIENCLCDVVPLYQSYDDMHEKYKKNNSLKLLLDVIRKHSPVDNSIISSCWFNVCKKDSTFGYHNHRGIIFTALYYVYGCENNGTIFCINNTYLKVLAKDNSVVYMDSNTMHTVPPWEKNDRYSIAVDFIKK